jgi:hypothetical protein
VHTCAIAQAIASEKEAIVVAMTRQRIENQLDTIELSNLNQSMTYYNREFIF